MKGKELRALREALGQSQAEFGRALGAHKNTVARWERDELPIRPPIAKLAQLIVAGALHQPPTTRPMKRSGKSRRRRRPRT